MHLTATPSKEVAQTLASTTSKWGLNREVRAALLRVRTGPECPEDNQRENFPAKSSNLRHCWATHRTKD